MQDFAFLFRSSAVLTSEDLSARNTAGHAWALTRRDEGVLRFAAPLESEGTIVGAEATTASVGDVASVLVIAAPDLEAAVALARAHPGLGYGTTIEVRPVKPTR